MNREDNHAELKPFLEALDGLKKNGFKGIAKIQESEWPLAGVRTQEIILEISKEMPLA
jgi:hypothetical protein